jgi:hypothetical protein
MRPTVPRPAVGRNQDDLSPSTPGARSLMCFTRPETMKMALWHPFFLAKTPRRKECDDSRPCVLCGFARDIIPWFIETCSLLPESSGNISQLLRVCSTYCPSTSIFISLTCAATRRKPEPVSILGCRRGIAAYRKVERHGSLAGSDGEPNLISKNNLRKATKPSRRTGALLSSAAVC